MLSILIPVYNRDVTLLVRELHRQALSQGIVFEIICVDDASTLFREENIDLKTLAGVQWVNLKENVGRSIIRNLLIEKASFEYLILLDCDMQICSDDFISNYLKNKHHKVICGGHCYSKEDHNGVNSLHYYNGVNREGFKEGDSNRTSCFMSGNFFIHKILFEKVSFSDKLDGYGHEDTLFGIELMEAGVEVVNLYNPTIHRGVDRDEVYIKKTRAAIDNLFNSDREIERKLHQNIRLTKFASEHRGLMYICGCLYPFSGPALEFAMKKFPSVCNLMDLYKLSYLGHLYIKRRR